MNVIILLTGALYLSLPVSAERICKLLVGLDQPLYRHYNSNITALTNLVDQHFQGVNQIFADNETGLFTGDLSDLRFKVGRVQVMFGSCDNFQSENCTENREKYLENFNHYDFSQYCLAYMFTYLDFHNGTAGLSKVGGACTPGDNSGFITLLNHQQSRPLNQSVITLAHELAHSLGAKHDDSEELAERECGTEFLMVSSSNETEEVRGEFSNCSLQDMRQTVTSLTCLLPDDEEPLEVSVCGNGLVEPGEQCDCGGDQLTCDDPCCYPAIISPQERAANSSALPCSSTARAGCVTPTHLMYGIYLPVLFIFIITVLLTVFLRHDWTRDKSLFKHVTEGNIRIVSQGSRTWHARNKETATSVEQSRFN